MIFRSLLTALLILIAYLSLFAQETFPPTLNFHKWGSITVFNGLPSDSVRAIAQTPDGIMWFGTDNGLARFDGRRIQNFSVAESDKNGVLALQAAPTGELWIGTENGAFVYVNGR